MIEILCDDSTSCKEACDNNDYHRSRQRQTFNMSVKSMRISLDHFFYCKRDDFDFEIVNFPFLDGDVPRSTSY